MSARRAARAAAEAVTHGRQQQSAGYVTERDAVICTRCGTELPAYAGRHLRTIHDALMHDGDGQWRR